MCNGAETVWHKYVELNGKQAYGFYCNATAQLQNSSNFIRFTQMQPNLTYVTQVKFRKCAMDFVLDQCKSVKKLNALDMSYSDYDRLNFTSGTFDNLKTINASNNRLNEISSIRFAQPSKIIEIDVSYNHIQRIDATTFANTTQLLRINLASNNLTAIDAAAFNRLAHLQSIDLSKNQLQTLEPLQNNHQLQVIWATENPISSFHCEHFVKMPAVSVFISWNRVKKLDFTCKKSTMQFRTILNGTVDAVKMHHSPITQSNDSEIHCTAGSMTQIESCTIGGRNRFRNITQLLQCFGVKFKRLMVSGSNFTATPSTLQRFTELEWLNLKDGALNEFDFRTVQHQNKLTRLDLSANHLKEVKNVQLLGQLNLIREFKISGNQLRNIREILANLKGPIKWLDLADNFVGKVNGTMFQRFKNLTTLKLSNNSLTILGDHNPFDAIKELSIFDISENDLTSMNFSILASTLHQLTRFYAKNCQLTNATGLIRLFDGQRLLELDLSGNDFGSEKFGVDTFKALVKLQYLNLNNVNLETFNFHWLLFNRELRAVKLSSNKLRSIDMTTAVLVNLKRLDVDDNELSDLNGMQRSAVPALDYMAISNNWLKCELLIRLQESFNGLKFIGEPLLHQKHGQNCYFNIRQTMHERKIYYGISILMAIAIASIAMIFVTWHFYCRKPKLTPKEEILRKIRQSMRESEYFSPNFQIPDDTDRYSGVDEYNAENNDIYDTISLEKHNYDHLQFDTDPMPFDESNNENYSHIGLMNGQILARNLTSRL